MQRCSRVRRRRGGPARLLFPPDADDQAKRSTGSPRWAFAIRSKCPPSCVAGAPDAIASLQGEFARGATRRDRARAPPPVRAFGQSRRGAVIAFDRFLAGLHGGGRLFSLLRQNPDLIALIALVLGTAPRLADGLAQFPEVMDAVVDPSFFGALPENAELRTGSTARFSRQVRYEDFLDRIRIFAQEQMFLIGTRILSGTVSAEQAGEAFARLADVLIRSLHRAVEEQFRRAAWPHRRAGDGDPCARQARRARDDGEFGPRLIVIYDFDHERIRSRAAPRPLYGAQYFSRLTQRLISALTAQTNYGVLYQVDMRLRPSGRAGPLATQIDGFAGYQENEAWTWEHMALTRARVVSASPEFAARVEELIRDRAVPPARRGDDRRRRRRNARGDRDARRATASAGTSNMSPAD